MKRVFRSIMARVGKVAAVSAMAALAAGMLFTSCILSTDPGNTDDPVTPGSLVNEQALVYSKASKFVAGTTSVEQAANMGIGWNLGNTFDSTSDTGKEKKGLDLETFWGMPYTTQSMIQAVQKAGFKTIRIPVSWHNHIEDGNTYEIDSAWMSRVKTVVDWALDAGMCVILNIHHDNLSISQMDTTYGFALAPESNAAVKSESKKYITSVWEQIATEFASYGNNLVFEVLNEPRDIGGEWKGNEWWCNNTEVMNCITEYEQAAIDTIRAIEGNESRFIMVPGYAASGSDSSELDVYNMPTDSAESRLMLSAHAYSPYGFAMYSDSEPNHTDFTSKDKSDLDSIFSYLNTYYVKKGIGVVMGEASASDKNNYEARVDWAKYYFKKAKEISIPVVLWDNQVTMSNGGNLTSGECHGWFNRKNGTWFFPSVIQAMMDTVYDDWDALGTSGSSDTEPEEPELPSTTVPAVVYNGRLVLDECDWSVNTTIPAEKFSGAGKGAKLVFVSENLPAGAEYKNVKLQSGDWGEVYSAGTATGATVEDGVLIPSSTSFTYTPTTAEWISIRAKGLVVYGYGLTITKISIE